MHTEAAVADVGVVVIGRNEGERLRTCLRSLDAAAHPTVNKRFVLWAETGPAGRRARTGAASTCGLALQGSHGERMNEGNRGLSEFERWQQPRAGDGLAPF